MWRCTLALLALLACSAPALAQSSPKHYLSAATNNSTLVLGRPSVVKMLHAVNVGATVYYLKLYDKKTAPTCGTDVPVFMTPVPAAASGGTPVSPDIGDGILFTLGVGFCITGLPADNDNTSAGTGVAVDLGVSGR